MKVELSYANVSESDSDDSDGEEMASQRKIFYNGNASHLKESFSKILLEKIEQVQKENSSKKQKAELVCLMNESLSRFKELEDYYFGHRNCYAYSFGMGEDGQLGDPSLLKDPASNTTEERNTKRLKVEVLSNEEKQTHKKVAAESESDDDEDVTEISIPNPTKIPMKQKFTSISAGSMHTVAITARGQVYGWGCTHGSCFGVSSGPGFINQPMLLQSGLNNSQENYVQVHAGTTFTILVSCFGRAYAAGSIKDANGKPFTLTGCGKKGYNVTFERMGFFDDGIVKEVSGGDSHVAVLTKHAKLYTFGIGMMGNLARPVNEKFFNEETKTWDEVVLREHLTPKLVKWKNGHEQNVLKVACGASHMLLVTDQRKLYTAGLNNYGQLGHGTITAYEGIPEFSSVDYLKTYQMDKVAAGNCHSFCKDVDGRLFTFGRADYGQLGYATTRKETEYSYPTPGQLELPNGEVAQDISCGDNHSLAISTSGNLYHWGFELAMPTNDDIYVPTKAKFVGGGSDVIAKQVSAGSQFSVVLAASKD